MSGSPCARADAHANIALVKYWGKSDVAANLPAVPSLSLTLDALRTSTLVTLDDARHEHRAMLDGAALEGRPRDRVVRVLEEIRLRAGSPLVARVESRNFFPSASGLASSASGFAALVHAAAAAYGLSLSLTEESRIARRASASAARSIFGGWVVLPAGTPGDDVAAEPVEAGPNLDLVVLLALVTRRPKDTSSTNGMERSRATSPRYESWVRNAPLRFTNALSALRRGDFEELGRLMEASTFEMHACAEASIPPVVYFEPITHRLYDVVRALRAKGLEVYATSDAGPHVKAFCRAGDADRVAAALEAVPGVEHLMRAKSGPGVALASKQTLPIGVET